MTSNHRTSRWLQAAFCGLALAGSASYCMAQGVNDYIVNQFSTDTGSWSYNYGGTTATIEWDSTQNHGPGASPGAMKVTIPFNICTGNIQSDFESNVLPDTLDLTTYSKVHFSVKVDPSSSRLSDWGGGAFGNMRFHVRPSSWATDDNIGSNNNDSSQWIGSDAYGAWVDYSLNIDHTTGLASKTVAAILGIDIWSGWGNCAAPIGHTNTVIFWMDNIWYEKVVGPPPAPPTVDLTKAGSSGVQITLDQNGNQWQREALVSPSGSSCFWAGNGATPVTYSFTISEFPDIATHPDFEAHMYIVNRDTSTAFDETYGGCDWNAPDIAILSVWAQTNGTYQAQFQFKTNRPNNNPIEDAVHRPAIVTSCPEILGTWSLTFTWDTNVTLSGPGGVSTNFTIPIEAVQNNFSPAASFLQFGFHKNDDENNGHNDQTQATISHVTKSGGAYTFDDTFNGATLTSNNAWRRTSATAVQHVPPGTGWFMNWTLPAIGFYPQSAPAVTGPWTDITTTSYQAGGKGHVTVPTGSAAYFRMIKRPFTKLQVLLPGETAAPNTVSGKTGTPTVQSSGVPFNITVNAVDAVWNVVASTDTVNITSTDGTATLPADAALASGTATFTVTLNSTGNWTITATDVTDGTKTPDTSSAVTIP